MSNPTDKTLVDGDKTILDDGTAPSVGSNQENAEESARPQHPGKIGHFTIIDTLGEGGMGAVYLAHQTEPVERKVALKLVHASLRSPEALARFTAERQAMARLSHPNIAALFEVGATDDGFPYFAMEHVPGASLTAYCDHHHLNIEQRLALFMQVCAGVQYAHQKGIMHRDLKPSNLLVAEEQVDPIPKIIDFGIAKAVDEPLTANGDLTGIRAIGTPDYMSPEALAGNQDIDTRSDVYSLGVVLYELLTGSRPHLPVEVASSMRAMTEWTPGIRPSVRIQKLDPETTQTCAANRGLSQTEFPNSLRGDLDWIVMKAISEEPDRRYTSASDFASDIKRHLAFEPVIARPPSTSYRVRRFVRRNRLAVAAGAMVLLALVLGIVGTTMGLIRAKEAEFEARLEAQRSEEVAGFMTELFAVSDPGEARGNSITARELLDRGASRIGSGLNEQPLLQARLMATMGDVYGKLGLYEQALALEQQTLQLRRAELGDNHPEVAVSLHAVGVMQRQLARYEDAQESEQTALAIREEQFGTDHPEYAESLSALATVEAMLGQIDQAEAHYRQSIAILERNESAEDLAAGLHNLGWLLGNQSRFEEAENLLLRALNIREDQLGVDHYDTAESAALLAIFYTLSGRYAEAETYHQQALETRLKVLEPDHPEIAESLLSLGTLYRIQGRYDDAEVEYLRALDLFETSLGPDHLNVGRVLGDLGLMLPNMDRWEEAADIYRRQLAIYEEILGPEHRLVGESLNNLGWVLSDGLQQYSEGERYLRRAVEIFEAGDPENYWNALSRWSLANNLRDQERYAEAEPFYQQALSILEQIGGADRADNPDLDELVMDYARSMRGAGREADAVTLENRLADSLD